MEILQGVGISEGTAYGTLAFFEADKNNIEKRYVTNIQTELERLKKAKHNTKNILQKIYEKAKKIMSQKNADIFKAHVLLLDSPDFIENITKKISAESLSAEYAVFSVSKELIDKLECNNMNSPVNDIEDVSAELIRNLRNEKFNDTIIKEKTIICAESFLPSQILEFNKPNIAAVCIINGKENSHTAIITRAMKIPAVTGVSQLTQAHMNKPAAVDAKSGRLYIQPDSETLKSLNLL